MFSSIGDLLDDTFGRHANRDTRLDRILADLKQIKVYLGIEPGADHLTPATQALLDSDLKLSETVESQAQAIDTAAPTPPQN